MPGLRTKASALILALVGTVGILAAACGGGQESSPEKLIPDDANLIAHVNLAGLLSSSGLLSLVSTVTEGQENPLTPDQILEETLDRTGVDLRQFSQAALFTGSGSSGEFAGLIAKGNFDEIELISSIRSAVDSRLTSAPYGDSLIYSAEDSEAGLSFAILKEEILVAGTGEAVRAVIDVQRGDREGLSGGLVETFDGLGAGLIRLAVAVPPDFLTGDLPDLSDVPFLGDALSGEGSLGLLGAVEGLRDLQFVGLVLAQNGQIFILRTNLELAREESADSISGLLGGLVSLASGFSPDQELTELLEKLEIRSVGSQVSVRLEIEGPEIAKLISSFTSIAQSETGVTGEDAPRSPRAIVQGNGDQREATPTPRITALGDEITIMPTSLHVPDGDEVVYSTTPPTSGDHWEQWADCGFYPEGLPDEVITHNLEHGNIVVSYNLSDPGQIARLRAAIDNIGLSGDWGVTRFYDEIPEDLIVLSAWGRMYGVGGPDPDSMEAFFSLYAGELGPERIPC